MKRRVCLWGWRWGWGSQVVLASVVAFFVWRAMSGQWDEFRSFEWSFAPRIAPIVGSGIIVLATYGMLIAAWRGIIVGWGQSLRPRDAIHIWTVANLGRYLPGKVWSIAGLVVLAQRAGVAAWASIGAAIAMQALAIGTGAAIAAIGVPSVLDSWQVIVGIVVGVAVVTGLMSGRVIAALGKFSAPEATLRPLPPTTALVAVAITGLSWVAYGVAFWLLARGLMPASELALRQAVGVFVVGYVAGLLALFAPGGIGVREAVYVAMLAPSVGPGGALILAAGARLLLTLTEVAAAGIGVLAGAGGPTRRADD